VGASSYADTAKMPLQVEHGAPAVH